MLKYRCGACQCAEQFSSLKKSPDKRYILFWTTWSHCSFYTLRPLLGLAAMEALVWAAYRMAERLSLNKVLPLIGLQ